MKLRTGNVAVIGEEAFNPHPGMTPSVPEILPPCKFLSGASYNNNKEKSQMKMIKNFLKDESGMETLEYAVIAGLIAAAAILVYTSSWSTTLSTRLNAASNTN